MHLQIDVSIHNNFIFTNYAIVYYANVCNLE